MEMYASGPDKDECQPHRKIGGQDAGGHPHAPLQMAEGSKGGRRFLASATNYMTAGQTVVVGGGQIAW